VQFADHTRLTKSLNQTSETPGAIARAAENPSNPQNLQNLENLENPM
jgi:hypothetical protein